MLELASRDAALEEDVELAVRATFGFRQAEVHPHNEEEAGAGPEEARLGAPVPRRRRELVVGDDVGHDAADVVDVSREDDRLGAQPRRRELRHERVADRADRQVVREGEDEQHAADRPLGARRLGDRREADDHQQREERAPAVHVQVAAPDDPHEEPRPDRADGAKGVLAHGQVERVGLGKAGVLVEDGRVAHEGVAAAVLEEPDDAADLGPAEIGPFQAIPIGSAR